MSRAPLGILFVGELRLHLRDGLSLLMMTAMPLVTLPLVFASLDRTRELATELVAPSAVMPIAAPPAFAAQILEEDGLVLVPEAEALLVVELPPSLTGDAPPERAPTVTLREQGSEVRRLSAASARVGAVLDRWQADRRDEAFSAAGLPVPVADLLRFEAIDLAPGAKRAGRQIGRLIPAILLFLMGNAALYTALDTFTGERERRTLESLITTRIDRRAILAVKATLVSLFCFLSGALALGSLALCLALGWVPLPPELAEAGLRAGGSGVVLGLGALLLPLAVQVTSAAVIVAAYATDFRVGQALSLPVLAALVGLGLVAALPDAALSPALALVPITGLALAMRDLVAGVATPGGLVLALLCASFHAGLALAAATRLLGREAVVVGPAEGAQRRGEGRTWPEALALFGIAVGGILVSSVAAGSQPSPGSQVLTQLGLLALPAAAMVRWAGLPLAETLSLRRPAWRDLGLAAAAGLLAPGLSLTVLAAQTPWLPVPASFSQGLEQAIFGDLPTWAAIALFSLLPAFCEEALFRGALLGLLRRSLPPVARVIAVALMFGALHLSVFRLLPTASLGLLLGAATLRGRSLWLAVLMHALHNAVTLGLSDRLAALPLAALALAGLGAAGAVAAMGRRS